MAYLNDAAGRAREVGRGVNVAAVAGTVPAGGTGAAAGGWDTAPHRDTAITTVAEIITSHNALLTSLKNAGVIASS
jgi:hypothetical protein